MKYSLFLLSALIVFCSKAQFSVSVGPSMIKSFGISGIFPGFHVGGEYAKDDQSSLFARVSFMPSKQNTPETGFMIATGKTFDVNPYSIQLESTEKINYTAIEIGRRYYFGNGLDYGFGFFGGSNLCFVFNKVKYEVQDFDENNYDLFINAEQISDRDKAIGNIFGFSFGLNAGIKNNFTFGTLYLDGGMNYAIYALPSNTIASTSTMYRQLFFSVNIGIKKDFY
ncbi:MAG: hypothetical protein HYU67_10295 [Flavobacteriia bacterium]|nr:hypothetical protein [Flavobacteriia bacterium]